MKTFNEKLDDLLDEYSVIDGRLFHHEDKKDFKQFIIDLVCGAVEEAKPIFIFDDGNNDATWAYKKGTTEYQNNLINIVRGK